MAQVQVEVNGKTEVRAQVSRPQVQMLFYHMNLSVEPGAHIGYLFRAYTEQTMQVVNRTRLCRSHRQWSDKLQRETQLA